MSNQNSILEALEHIRKRPLMYFSNDVPAVVNFLEGFTTACLLLKPVSDYNASYQTVIEARGWEYSAMPVWRQMKEQGMADATVVDELLAIHQEVWTQLNIDTAQAVKNEAK